jgi:guanylate kinase
MKQVLVIAGPTGSGESTITQALLGRFPHMRRLITATTRAPRSNETGDEYYFFSKEEFLAKKEQGLILESTYQANRDVYYGTYAPDLEEKLAAGFIVIMNPDIVGARYYKEHHNATTIFLRPQNIEELMGRIQKRNPNISETELQHRRESAEAELRDEQPFYDYVVVNEDGGLERAINEVIDILKKEGYETSHGN